MIHTQLAFLAHRPLISSIYRKFLDEADDSYEAEYDEYGQLIDDSVRRFFDYEEYDYEAGTELRPGWEAEAVRQLRRMRYDDYRQTPHWLVTRTLARRRAGYQCQQCFDRAARLHVHHLTYARLGCEAEADLIVLCGKCHAAEHGTAPSRPRVRL